MAHLMENFIENPMMPTFFQDRMYIPRNFGSNLMRLCPFPPRKRCAAGTLHFALRSRGVQFRRFEMKIGRGLMTQCVADVTKMKLPGN